MAELVDELVLSEGEVTELVKLSTPDNIEGKSASYARVTKRVQRLKHVTTGVERDVTQGEPIVEYLRGTDKKGLLRDLRQQKADIIAERQAQLDKVNLLIAQLEAE